MSFLVKNGVFFVKKTHFLLGKWLGVAGVALPGPSAGVVAVAGWQWQWQSGGTFWSLNELNWSIIEGYMGFLVQISCKKPIFSNQKPHFLDE
jgi:hypothetical protein